MSDRPEDTPVARSAETLDELGRLREAGSRMVTALLNAGTALQGASVSERDFVLHDVRVALAKAREAGL